MKYLIIYLFALFPIFTNAEVFSDYERQILATVLILEAGGESYTGMHAVMNVLVNRSNGDLDKVVSEAIRKGQFASMKDVWGKSKPDYSPLITKALKHPSYTSALNIVKAFESDDHYYDPSMGATHFHTITTEPYWASSLEQVQIIGNHVFYK